MITFLYLLKAWVIGIAIAAPVGPIGMLCIKKTLEFGFLGAIAVGLGAALADSVYGAIAATGLTVISEFLLEKEVVIKLIGGIFLIYLGYKEIKSSPTSKSVTTKSKNLYLIILEIFFLTITNPMTILSFIGIFASISNGPTSELESLTMVLGIFLGSMTWWLILGGIIIKVRHKLPDAWLHRIRYLSALILCGFGVFAVYSTI